MASAAEHPQLGPHLTQAARSMLAETGRIRVLQVITWFGTGGTEHGISKVVLGLKEAFEHRICALRGFDPDFVSAACPEFQPLVVGRSEGFQFPVLRLAAVMRSFRPHIVHSRNWGTIEAILAARLAGVPVVIHGEHGYEPEMLAGMPWRRRLARRAIYTMADALLTVSEELREYHARQSGIARERIRVIYNGVDTARFSPSAHVRQETRAQLGLPSESTVIGTVGRMVPIKNQGMLLEAGEALLRRGYNVRLLLVGSGPELERLRERVHSNPVLAGKTTFCGVSERVPQLLNAMDMFALPSSGEGMSNTLLEAMACGLPVVASRVGGNPEVVREGHTGYLCGANDKGGLVEHLRQLSENAGLRLRLGAQARQYAVKHFGLERMLREYGNLYLELLERRGVLKPAGRPS